MVVLVLALVFLVSACTDSAAVTTITALPRPTTPRPVITFPPLDPDLVVGTDRYPGYLPDGTNYVVYLQTSHHEEVTNIRADLMYEDGSSGVWWVGGVGFRHNETADQAGVADNVLTVPAGPDWTAVVELNPDFLEHLGPHAGEILLTSVQAEEVTAGSRHLTFPVLQLTPPFRWATTHDPVDPMEVQYESFVVRPGCDDEAAACTWTGMLQMLSRPGYSVPAADIDSGTLRPRSDPNYLDPGPLATRHDADVFWTGDEMVVWGGQSAAGVWQASGAAFDPATSRWRVFTGPPVGEAAPSRAVWVDDEMVVVTSDATYSGDPTTDAWTTIGTGMEPPGAANQMAVAVDHVYAWLDGSVVELDPATGVWTTLPDAGFSRGEIWLLAFREFDDALLVSSLPAERCQGHDYWSWSGAAWNQLPTVSLSTSQWADCSLAYQVGVVGGQLIGWDDNQHPTKGYDPVSGEWDVVATIPMEAWDNPPGAVVMGDRMLVSASGDGAVYDSVTDSWQTVDLPGSDFDTRMVWTGDEVLAWGAAHNDAWRWTPPD